MPQVAIAQLGSSFSTSRKVFSALYIAATQVQSDQTYAAYLKAAGILEPMFRKYPDHPGVAHYLIHSYDAAPIAAKGLDAARRYAEIAPAAPHALHMPSHIFTRVGAWQESAAINLRSFNVAKAGNEGVEAYHAMDYAVYAYLQQARDAEAKRTIQEAMKVTDYNANIFVAPYAIAAMQARYALERADWRTAMDLVPGKSKFPHVEAITYFARAIGAIRARTPASAEDDALALDNIHKALVEAKNTYWATEVEVQQLAVAAWLAHARGKSEEALKLMRASADLEDGNEKHIVTPGRIVPARELLAEMLIEQNQPAAALVELEASRKREPNRFRNYSASAKAANMAGDKAKSAEYAAKLLELAKDADTRRSEINQAYNLMVRNR